MKHDATDILLLIPNLNMGGAQKVFHDHSLLLSERYRVEEAVFNLELGHAFPTGNRLHNLHVGGGGGLITKGMNLWRRVRGARRLKDELKPKLCISHMPGADYVNLLSRRQEKTIAVVHGSKRGDESQSGWLGKLQSHLMVPWLYRRADAVVVVSRDLASELAELGVDRRKIRVINNFFEHEKIHELAAQDLGEPAESLFDGVPVLITTGRLAEQKNHAGLLEVFARLRARRPARLLILGDGPLRQDLVKRASELGLNWWAAWQEETLLPGRDVYFLGAQQNPFKWMARADLFVLPSGWEGFPLALCEAMICGLPVASTDCRTGPREILLPHLDRPAWALKHEEEGEGGVLLPGLHNPDKRDHAEAEWTNALDRLISDAARRKRLGDAARIRMQAFTREEVGSQWFELVTGLLI